MEDRSLLESVSIVAANNKEKFGHIYYDIVGFHPDGHVATIIKDDDYFYGARADHFIIIDGYCEEYGAPTVMILCNHKGDIHTEFIVYKEA